MSALGSSVINKSSKKFGPKQASARRAPISNQASARPSADRQLQSQTPQPQPQLQPQLQPQPSEQRAAATPVPTPSTSVDIPVASEPSVTAYQIAAQPNAAVAKNTPATQAISFLKPGTSQNSLRTQSANENASGSPRQSSPIATSHASPARREPSVATPSSPEPTNGGLRVQQYSSEESRPAATPISQPSPALQQSRPNAGEAEQGAAKRRRVAIPTEDRVSQTPETASHVEDIPPSQEANEATPYVVVGSAAPSQVYSQPIRQSIEPAQLAKAKKLGSSKQAKTRKRANKAAAAEVVPDEVGERSRKRKRMEKSRRPKPVGMGTAQQTAENVAVEVIDDASNTKKPSKKRKKRESTPEDAEDFQIVPSQIIMSDLTGNVRTGRRSSRDKELQVMQEAEKDKKKLARKKAREGVTEEPLPPDNQEPTETAEERLERLARERHRSPSYDRAVPTTIIVNGQIQLDESSLVIDRHARAARAREAVAEEAVEETELTRRITSASWLKVDRSGGWNEVLTDQFYDGLRMFGTDFYMISKMFPGRTRHSVKLKFNKEEKLNAWRIEATLKGEKLPVNMDEFSKMSNTVFSDPKELDREMDEDRERIEKEEALAKAAMEEADKERAEQAAREAAAEAEEESSKEHEADGLGESGYVTMKQKRKQHRKTIRETAGKQCKTGKKGAGARPQATSGGVTS